MMDKSDEKMHNTKIQVEKKKDAPSNPSSLSVCFHSVYRLKRADHQLVWDHRLHCRKDHPSSLPKVLASVPSWDWASMAHIHSLLHHWPTLPPVTALEMLDSKYALYTLWSMAPPVLFFLLCIK